MTLRKVGAALSLIAMLAGCGGGGGDVAGEGTGIGTGIGSPTPTPTPTPPTTGGCALRDRQNWAAAQLREWYLFPETLPTALDPSPYSTVTDYIDALTATARSQGRDRYFTYLTSIAEENAYYAAGSSAGFGLRLATDGGTRIVVTEAYEGTPALAAGIDRGAEILAIGTSAATLRTVSSIIASEGLEGVTNALGADTPGTSRTLQIADGTGTRTVSITKAEFELPPVSSRYGARIIEDGGRRVGYVNLRTFISTADPALRAAFAQFRTANVTEIIVDLRYNGGGLLSIADLLGDLLGGNRFSSDIFSYTTYRPEKSLENKSHAFQRQAQSVSPTRVAFIGTGGTASASELVINGFIPYLHANAGLIGTNTYGKPVGQIALDRASCDDRLRVIAFATQNSQRQGNYFSGLAGTVEASCQAVDDIGHPLGNAQESSIRQALDFLAGKSCTAIASGQSGQSLRTTKRQELLVPARPSTVQREVPGSF